MKKTTLAMSALALSLGLALSPLTATAAETASSAATAQQMPSMAPMLEKVMPSVVSINVEGSTTVNTPRMPRNFQQFFGDNSPFCQDGSPFQSSPFCQGGGAGDDSQGGGQQQSDNGYFFHRLCLLFEHGFVREAHRCAGVVVFEVENHDAVPLFGEDFGRNEDRLLFLLVPERAEVVPVDPHLAHAPS